MGINLKSVAAYIHSAAPGTLDGLFHAVEEKCKALGLSPGSRDNVAITGDGTSGSINIRGVLTFVESVEPITDEEKQPLTADDADKPAEGDSLVVLAEKENRRAYLPTREKERKARVDAKQVALNDLRKLYGTLKARFASAGYKPKPPAVT